MGVDFLILTAAMFCSFIVVFGVVFLIVFLVILRLEHKEKMKMRDQARVDRYLSNWRQS